ncbi:MAG: hypothetical protein IPN91_11230 [Holophagaceae bacterium]|uniref:Tubulin/FtsZ 2-layer sandwich domain-containing protein n=1 Tax=Candidatus Geothrix odensensis TaxID=2954440 RepID=A0A936F4Y7_9BACT|nr:hypothetical protein [Candidatus Geothrix odensensis]
MVSNERLKNVCDARVTMKEAFRVADGVLIQGVRGIADLILKPGIINGDFADVEAVLRNGGEALIGTGTGRGEEAVMDAVKKALACPLLERAQAAPPPTSWCPSPPTGKSWRPRPSKRPSTISRIITKGRPDIKGLHGGREGMEDRVVVTILASGFDQEDRLEEERRISLHLGAAPDSGSMAYASAQVAQSQPLPPNVVSGRVYGEVPAGELQGPTPTRLRPQAPTPSGEVPGADDLHIPAIMRMRQGQLLGD